MSYDALLMLTASALGLAQVNLSSRNSKFVQIQRNFEETYYVVIICFLITMILGGGGSQGIIASGFYLVGRLLYVLVALIDQLKFRKLAWATSMVGVIGLVLVAVKAIGQLFV